jgi:hypothetical protein
MNKLTKYWMEKKFVLHALLDASAEGPDKDTVRTWLENITSKPSVANSPERLLEDALDALAAKRAAASQMTEPSGPPKPNPNRRSKRLLALVQGAVGDGHGGTGFTAAVADLSRANQPNAVKEYFDEAGRASVAAANFLSAVKSEREGDAELSAVIAALHGLRGAAGGKLDEFILESIDGLLKSMEAFVAHGGGGEGSGYWPSTIISSSSSSSSSGG